MIDESIFDDIARRLPAGLDVIESTIGIHWALYGLVRLTRPETILEIGCCYGDATCFLVRAAIHNGMGHVIGYEPDGNRADATKGKVARACGADAPFELRGGFPVEHGPVVAADFVFLDLDPKEHYPLAFQHLLLSPGGLLCTHDLTYLRDMLEVRKFHDSLKDLGWETLGLPQERGLSIARKP